MNPSGLRRSRLSMFLPNAEERDIVIFKLWPTLPYKIRLPAGMMQLQDRSAAVLLDCLGDSGDTGNELIVAEH